MMGKLKIFIAVIPIILFNNCSDILDSNNDKSKKIDDVQLVGIYDFDEIPEKCIDATNDFSMNLFQTLNPHDGDKNIFISPVSVSFALGMTMNGSDGKTYDEMKNALGFSDLNIDEINATYYALIHELYDASDGVKFNLANSIWYREEFELANEFQTLNQNYFNAKVEGLNFNDGNNTLKTINGWVEDQTEDRIKDLLKTIDPNAIMYLINAIYFKASWKYQFDEELTIESRFYSGNGLVQNCEMMNMKRELNFIQGTDYDALELPYGNENYSMLLLRPKSETINNFVQIINRDVINDITSSFIKDSINISIPKIELKYEKELNDILIEMGMVDAFDQNNADFSKMFKTLGTGIWIEMVKQKAFLKINEEGTEAAAATVVQMNFESVSDEKFMSFNSPFLFFITERRTGTILFCGKIIEIPT